MANTFNIDRILACFMAGLTVLTLSGCAVKPLKAPCSRDEGRASAKALFAFPISRHLISRQQPQALTGAAAASKAMASIAARLRSEPSKLGLTTVNAPEGMSHDTCGPMRRLNTGFYAWR